MKSLKELFEIQIRTTMIFLCLSISVSICTIGCFFQYQQIQLDFELTENFISEATRNVLIEQQPILLQQSLQEFWNAFDKKISPIIGFKVSFDEVLVSQVGFEKGNLAFTNFDKKSCLKAVQHDVCIHFFVDPLRFFKKIFYFLLAVIISSLAAYFFMKKIANNNIRLLVEPLEAEIQRISILNQNFKNGGEGGVDLKQKIPSQKENMFLISEVFLLSESYKDLLMQSQKYIDLNNSIELAESIKNLTSQVAHDIRSPLSALTIVVGTLKEVPEEKRILIRNATQRINDIANDLLQKGQKNVYANHSETELSWVNKDDQIVYQKFTTEFIPALIDILVSEKRMQYREFTGLDIEPDFKDSFGAFAKINSNELKRVISNLINNAVEAFNNHQGRVKVGVKKIASGQAEQVEIIVQDNGRGIPLHVLTKLGQMGVSYGKEGTQSGIGLGVHHAKKTTESFGGTFQIESQEQQGTLIRITLPLAESPSWFADKVDLTGKKYLVSLDDDVSVHQIWSGRLQSAGYKDVEHIRFQSGEAFLQFVNSNINELWQTLFLVDYELLNQPKTGLDLIEDLGIEKYSILVTSRYEEASIQARVSYLRLSLLPKTLVGFVPFEMHDPKAL